MIPTYCDDFHRGENFFHLVSVFIMTLKANNEDDIPISYGGRCDYGTLTWASTMVAIAITEGHGIHLSIFSNNGEYSLPNGLRMAARFKTATDATRALVSAYRMQRPIVQ